MLCRDLHSFLMVFNRLRSLVIALLGILLIEELFLSINKYTQRLLWLKNSNYSEITKINILRSTTI